MEEHCKPEWEQIPTAYESADTARYEQEEPAVHTRILYSPYVGYVVAYDNLRA